MKYGERDVPELSVVLTMCESKRGEGRKDEGRGVRLLSHDDLSPRVGVRQQFFSQFNQRFSARDLKDMVSWLEWYTKRQNENDVK